MENKNILEINKKRKRKEEKNEKQITLYYNLTTIKMKNK